MLRNGVGCFWGVCETTSGLRQFTNFKKIGWNWSVICGDYVMLPLMCGIVFFLFICLFQKIRFRCVNERHSFAAQRHSKRHSFFLFICQSPIYWFWCCWLRHSFRCLSPTIYLNYNPKIFYKVGKAQKRCRNWLS